VLIQRSIPYSHWKVAVERDVQTVVYGVSVLLHGQEWSKADSWDLALQHFVSIRNRTPNAKQVLSHHCKSYRKKRWTSTRRMNSTLVILWQ
jgi:hypothetical protein